MAEYNTTSGAWLTVNDNLDGEKVKLVNECVPVQSRFKDEKTGEPKTENQVKAQFEGMEGPVNMRLNWTTVYALVEAFGKESKGWIGHTLTAKVKDMTTGQSVYLVPAGFELYRNEEKRWAIRKIGGSVPAPAAPIDVAPEEPVIEYPEEEIAFGDV